MNNPQTLTDVSNKARDTLKDVKDKAMNTEEQIKDLGQVAVDAVRQALNRLADNAATYYHKGVDGAKDMEESLESRIKERPLSALLIAAGVGALIGLMMKKR